MNCEAVRKQLLGMEDPGRPPAGVATHLAGCAACRDWQRQLLLVERNVPRLPVPESGARLSLLRRFLREAPAGAAGSQSVVEPADEPTVEPNAEPRHEAAPAPGLGVGPAAGPRRWWFAAAAGAAAGAALAIAVWQFRAAPEPPPEPTPSPQDPLLAKLVQADVRLAGAESPVQRVEAMADLADDLHVETRGLVHTAPADDLAALAGLYENVVRKGLVPCARAVAPAHRRQALTPLAERFERTARDADALARAAPPAAATALGRIAGAAREGDTALREIIRGTER